MLEALIGNLVNILVVSPLIIFILPLFLTGKVPRFDFDGFGICLSRILVCVGL